MTADAEINDQRLLRLILAADDELLAEGIAPPQRTVHIISRVMEKLGYRSFVMLGTGAPEITKRISAIHSSLYRQQDIATGGIHGGIFMFRDVFVRVNVPLIYGQITIDPLKLTEFNSMQAGWLQDRPADFKAFMDQFIDIFDFAGGVEPMDDYKAVPNDLKELVWLAAFQLQAAAATLSAAYDSRGAIQSSLIGAELALKFGLAFAGASDKERRDHGHNLLSAAKHFAQSQTAFDIDRVSATISRLPQYVANRYSASQPGRVETGHIAMGAQYIAAEVMRQITGHTMRTALPHYKDRMYPSL